MLHGDTRSNAKAPVESVRSADAYNEGKQNHPASAIQTDSADMTTHQESDAQIPSMSLDNPLACNKTLWVVGGGVK